MKDAPHSVEILANAASRKALASGEFDGVYQERLIKKLADLKDGMIEPKGRGFYGIEFGSNYRAIFTLNAEKQPVMVFIGDHRKYDEFSSKINTNADEVKRTSGFDTAQKISLLSGKISTDVTLDEFTDKFGKATRLEGVRAMAAELTTPMQKKPAAKTFDEVDEQLKNPTEKLVSKDPGTGSLHICDVDSGFLVTIDKTGKKSIEYSDAAIDRFNALSAHTGYEIKTAKQTLADVANHMSGLSTLIAVPVSRPRPGSPSLT